MRDVLVLTTGGTIEKVHDWRSEGLGFGQEDGEQVVDLLADGRCHHAALLPLMMKDSLDFDDADRQQILDAVLASTQGAIVITHGTGTLGQTAAYLDGRVGARTVVLTGAMRPHSLGRSDASFNMGGASASGCVWRDERASVCRRAHHQEPCAGAVRRAAVALTRCSA
jgi:L-asparaginase